MRLLKMSNPRKKLKRKKIRAPVQLLFMFGWRHNTDAKCR